VRRGWGGELGVAQTCLLSVARYRDLVFGNQTSKDFLCNIIVVGGGRRDKGGRKRCTPKKDKTMGETGVISENRGQTSAMQLNN